METDVQFSKGTKSYNCHYQQSSISTDQGKEWMLCHYHLEVCPKVIDSNCDAYDAFERQ